jgi:peptidoglycan hydrolase CwlO-like protein
MRLILIFCLLSIASLSIGQIALASNKQLNKSDVKRNEQNLIAQPANNTIEAIANQLKNLQKRSDELEKKNDDLAKENEELKKSILVLQVNIRIQSNLQPTKLLLTSAIVDNTVYDY